MKEVYLAKINSRGDTIRSGFYHSFYRNGCPDQRGYYRKNKLSGEWILSDQNGFVEQKLTYKKGKQNGPFERFYTQSQKLEVYG